MEYVQLTTFLQRTPHMEYHNISTQYNSRICTKLTYTWNLINRFFFPSLKICLMKQYKVELQCDIIQLHFTFNINWDEQNFADTKIGSWLVTLQHLYCLQFGYCWLEHSYKVLLQRDWLAVDKLKFHLSLLCLAFVWQLFQIINFFFFACSLEICSLKWGYYSVNNKTWIKWSEE